MAYLRIKQMHSGAFYLILWCVAYFSHCCPQLAAVRTAQMSSVLNWLLAEVDKQVDKQAETVV